jgi:threonine/homoserine/homoserine lactone efflux protein
MGFLLGLSGLIPGPLLTLVISETLKHGTKAGIKVSVSPLITDLPIILVTILIMSRFSDTDFILGSIAFAGSIFLFYLACESFSFRGASPGLTDSQAHVMKKGIIANFLNPSPYVFWFTIGAPTIIKASGKSLIGASLFLVVFYSVLVGSKVVIAVITGKAKNFLGNKYYIYLIRLLGIILLVFALYFVKNGLQYFF